MTSISKDLAPTGFPSSLGYSMPAEWAPQEAIWLAWPHNVETWPGKRLGIVEEIYLTMIEALVPDEKVKLLVKDKKEEDSVLSRLKARRIQNIKNLVFIRKPTVDAWIRDYGPTFVTRRYQPSLRATAGREAISEIASPDRPSGTGRLSGRLPLEQPASSPSGTSRNDGHPQKAYVKWIFNAWGNKYPEIAEDHHVFSDKHLIPHPSFDAGFVLEGGSIEVNGEGVCMATEQCLLNKNRNPQLSKVKIEENLKNYLGVSEILWLKKGIVGDDTDGHIDDIARFVAPKTILAAYEENVRDENHELLKENREILKRASLGETKRFDIVKFPMPEPVVDEGVRLPASYANFLIANKVILLPVFRCKKDDRAIRILKELFPRHLIVPIDCNAMIYGFGAIHCVSQQEPKSEIPMTKSQ